MYLMENRSIKGHLCPKNSGFSKVTTKWSVFHAIQSILNRSWCQLGKDVLWSEPSTCGHSHTCIKKSKSKLQCLYLSITCTFRCYQLRAYFPVAYKSLSEPWRHIDSCLNFTQKWKYWRDTLWIWVCTRPCISIKLMLHNLWGYIP